jgi:hypothetical protein
MKLLRSPVVPGVLLLGLMVVLAARADTSGLNGKEEGPIIDLVREALQLERDAIAVLGTNPNQGEYDEADEKLDEAIRKMKEAVDRIDAVNADPNREFQPATAAEEAKEELGSETEGGRATGAIGDDRKAQKKIAKFRPANKITRSIQKGIDRKLTAIAYLQGYRLPGKALEREFANLEPGQEVGDVLSFGFDHRKTKNFGVAYGFEFQAIGGMQARWAKDRTRGGGRLAFRKKGNSADLAGFVLSLNRRFTGDFDFEAEMGILTDKPGRRDPADLEEAVLTIELDKFRQNQLVGFTSLNVRYVENGIQAWMDDPTGTRGNVFYVGVDRGFGRLSRVGNLVRAYFRPDGSEDYALVGETDLLGNDGEGLDASAGARGNEGAGETSFGVLRTTFRF